jgi:hypothetical protein
MNLDQAQQHFMQDTKYRAQYVKHKDCVSLAMNVVAIRKQLGLSHQSLAAELKISKYDISKFENLKGHVAPWVISVIVSRFEPQLRERGVSTEKWFVPRPQRPEMANNDKPPLDVSLRTSVVLPGSRRPRQPRTSVETLRSHPVAVPKKF